MGFRPPQKVYKLVFEDEDLAGLVVRARSTSIGTLLGLGDIAAIDPDDPSPAGLAKLRELFETFAAALVEWNVEHPQSGEPVPATFEGVTSLDADFALAIVRTWVRVLTDAPAPLGAPSSDGPPSPAPSIPMAPLSESQAS